ncbi:hypothetical protein HYPSUDRAFT_70451 [Hypholoma sublateritium FD-334 SS-4]|uniref:Cupin type-2 domain-containing protein n=1 Tax=Hypholoma sublateritium (strain FD-334 SS-4) TaxID=945553 RepID=A0A0D2KT60_HYPSF|nr:hypothetical protein HYPSUDRAFT_70451 [Hypholoma sublateritium FD-334 SS-4]
MSESTSATPSIIPVAPGSSMTFLQDSPYLTRIHIAKDVPEEVSVPPHWHELHDEVFHVVEGRLEVLVGTVKRFYVPEDGQILIPKGTLHSLRVVKGEECVFEEGTVGMVRQCISYIKSVEITSSADSDRDRSRVSRTLTPCLQGPEKELFFRNMYAEGEEASGFFAVMQIMYHGDMRPGLPLHIKWLERLLVGFAGYYIAPLLGYKLAIPSIKKNI